MKSDIDVWIAVVIGVVIGAMAHFGRLISDENLPTWHVIIGFMMQLGLIALVAASAVEQFQIKSSLMQSLTAAVFAIAANEIITWLKSRAVDVAKKVIDK